MCRGVGVALRGTEFEELGSLLGTSQSGRRGPATEGCSTGSRRGGAREQGQAREREGEGKGKGTGTQGQRKPGRCGRVTQGEEKAKPKAREGKREREEREGKKGSGGGGRRGKEIRLHFGGGEFEQRG